MGRYISTMSADSVLFQRGRGNKQFYGCLGACLGFTEPQSFQDTYNLKINEILAKNGTQRNRVILKSYDLRKTYGKDGAQFLADLGGFVKLLDECGVVLNCTYTTLNPQKIPDGISLYGTGKYPVKQCRPIDFLKRLSNYYPYIVTWKVSKAATLRGATAYLDHFTGEYTSAWGELCAHHTVYIVPKGDSCNVFISAADLVVRYIDEYLSVHRLHLNQETIEEALRSCGVEEPHIHYIGHGDFRSIVPLRSEQIPYAQYYPRPMSYILPERIFDKDQNVVERSPLYHKILEFAFRNNAGVKFFSEDEDLVRLNPGDYLIYLGESGKQKAEYLQALYGTKAVKMEFSHGETLHADL